MKKTMLDDYFNAVVLALYSGGNNEKEVAEIMQISVEKVRLINQTAIGIALYKKAEYKKINN